MSPLALHLREIALDLTVQHFDGDVIHMSKAEAILSFLKDGPVSEIDHRVRAIRAAFVAHHGHEMRDILQAAGCYLDFLKGVTSEDQP